MTQGALRDIAPAPPCRFSRILARPCKRGGNAAGRPPGRPAAEVIRAAYSRGMRRAFPSSQSSKLWMDGLIDRASSRLRAPQK